MRALWTLALAGCSVSPPAVIDDGFFACTDAASCGPDQACAEGNVYSPDFCRPACDRSDSSTCPDGVCTAAGACLARCTIDIDGATAGCPDEFRCVRIDAVRGEGVCFPVEGCSRSADCESEDGVAPLCLNDALGLPANSLDEGFRFDNLYCTAGADEAGRCPTGYLGFRFASDEGPFSVCYAPCALDGDGPFCPPATTCFRGFGQLVGAPDTPPCLPGVWGLPCEDDTQCLLGRCLPIGGGRRACTETCADAELAYGGCAGLERYAESFGAAVRMRCEERVCVPRFDLLSLCSEQLDCVGADTVCLEVASRATTASVCARFCVDAADCARDTGAPASDYRCVREASEPTGFCLRKRPLGARCADTEDCREGVCCELGELAACLRECR